MKKILVGEANRDVKKKMHKESIFNVVVNDSANLLESTGDLQCLSLCIFIHRYQSSIPNEYL